MAPALSGTTPWYIPLVDTKRDAAMATAKLFKNGRSQAVRLPKEFRFEGSEVRIRREGEKVILEPVPEGEWDWLEEREPFSDDFVEFVLNSRPGPDEYDRLKDDER